jgi:hypothetical protein
MSSGIELIPLAIVGIAHLASSIKERMEEAKQSGLLRVETRMADKQLVQASLTALGYKVSSAGEGFNVSIGDGTFTMDKSSSGAWFAQCSNPSEFQQVSNALVSFEAEYLRQLQISLVHEINQNAASLGMTVHQEELPDRSVRLSVMVGGA